MNYNFKNKSFEGLFLIYFLGQKFLGRTLLVFDYWYLVNYFFFIIFYLVQSL